MIHQKRQQIPKGWPMPRKGTKFVVRAKSQGIPLLVVLRDILKIAQNRKEVKRALNYQNVLVNEKIAKDERKGLMLFDKVKIIPMKKTFEINLKSNGKFALKEIEEKKSNFKTAKVVNKKILKGKKVQLNLSDGNNFLTDIECKTNDSALINLKERKIEKCIPLEEKSPIIVFAGKHAGEAGILEKVKENMAEIKVDNGKIRVLIKQIMAVE